MLLVFKGANQAGLAGAGQGFGYSMSQQTDTATIEIRVLSITPISNASRLLALADVSVILDGVELVIHGVQVRAGADKTEITLPTYRAPSGEWKTAITLPDEVRQPMGDAVIAAALELGLLKERSPNLSSQNRQ